MTAALPPPKPPASWRNYDRQPDMSRDGVRQMVWRRGRLVVISSVSIMDFRGKRRPQWLVSVSSRGTTDAGMVQRHPERFRATDQEVIQVLRDFDMGRAEEDNHQPGCARMFFLLCDARPDDPPQCECKETEEVVTEPDGFTWSRERQVSTSATVTAPVAEGELAQTVKIKITLGGAIADGARR